jgi:diguanylate cyclase
MHYAFLLLLFTFSIGYLLTGIFIIYKDKDSNLNRLFFMLCIEMSIWAFGYAFMIICTNKISANYFRIIAAPGWCFFSSTWLDFAISIGYGKGNKPSFKRRLILYLPSLFFLINTIGYSPEIVVNKLSFGYSEHTPTNIIAYLYAFYYISFILISLLVIYRWGKQTRLNREKKQVNIILITTFVSFGLGVITDTLLPSLGIDVFQSGIIVMSIGILGLWKAITKYRMLAITSEYISEYIFKGVNNPIFFIDDNLNLKSVNDIALETIGYTYNELDRDFFQAVMKTNHMNINILIENGFINNRELVFTKKDGSFVQFILSATVIYDDFEDLLGIVIILQDVSEQKEAEQLLRDYNNELENKIAERTKNLEAANKVLKNEIADRISAEEKILYMGYYDELTGLPNRRYFNENISKLIDRIKYTGKNFAILFLDIDDFKIVNDTYGHLSGDELLKQLAARMADIVKEGDLLARIGGDEFLILITNLSVNESNLYSYIMDISQKILKLIKEPILIKGKENFLTTSMGVAFYPLDGTDADTLIMNADMAMYEAKNSGKNNVKLCTEDIKSKMLQKTKFRNDLYRAIEKDEMVVYYQPQVNINMNRIIGFEALLRWNYNKANFISPMEFIPLAEETGLIVPIGYWVIKKVCSDLNKLQSTGLLNLCAAINLSRNQLREGNFVQEVMKILYENNLRPEFLEFEITERIMLKDDIGINLNLEELKRLGFKISIDDFGTEYSSYMNLKRLPIDKIKIAMEFIQESTQNHKDASIVKSIIDLSHNLNLSIIGEGVETQEQLEFLQNNKCDEIQGYLFYKPMPYKQLETVLKNEVFKHVV